MKLARLPLGCLVAFLVLAGTVMFTATRTANPIGKLDFEHVDSISFTPADHSMPLAEPPAMIVLPPSGHKHIIETLRATRVDWNPAKWQTAGEMVINSADGTVTELDFYDTGTEVGAFRIGNTYYRFDGNCRKLVPTGKDAG